MTNHGGSSSGLPVITASHYARTHHDDPAPGRSRHHNRGLRGFLWIHAVLSPVMFFSNETLWPTITLIVSIVAIMLTALAIFGGRRGRLQADGNNVIAAPHEAPGLTRSPCRTACVHIDPDAHVRPTNGELATMSIDYVPNGRKDAQSNGNSKRGQR